LAFSRFHIHEPTTLIFFQTFLLTVMRPLADVPVKPLFSRRLHLSPMEGNRFTTFRSSNTQLDHFPANPSFRFPGMIATPIFCGATGLRFAPSCPPSFPLTFLKSRNLLISQGPFSGHLYIAVSRRASSDLRPYSMNLTTFSANMFRF